MKRIFNWQVIIGLSLIFLSASVYYIHYLIFKDARHIFTYLIGDIAFAFFELFLVTLVIHGLLDYRDKKAMLKKLNMVIGAFYSEVGTELMRFFSKFDQSSYEIADKLIVDNKWPDKEFAIMQKMVKAHVSIIECKPGDIENLKSFLINKRQFLLALLENPNLLEHESFTNLLWAVFHLTEELASRKGLKTLSDADLQHLKGDIKRAYSIIISEWLSYMSHLKNDYPYLFSMAMRTNPFDPNAEVELK